MIRKILRKISRKLLISLGALLHEVNGGIAQATLPQFGNNPKNLTIELPRRIMNAEHIFLGNNVSIGPGSLMYAVTQYPTSHMKHPENQQDVQSFSPSITIGHGVTATANLQIVAMSEITIEDDVMFASNINITDGFHGYENGNEPYKYQKLFRIAPINIRKGCHVGQNVVILPGVTIGEFSIIGANSVVNSSIPDRSIAVGSPARVIKTWDEKNHTWSSYDSE